MLPDLVKSAPQKIALPAEVEAVFRNFWTCEFTTLSEVGAPITWPVLAVYRPGAGQFVIATSIGIPQKAVNVRRDPRVSLLFSEPTGCGLDAPATVLIQGDAEAPDRILCSPDEADAEMWAESLPQIRRLVQAQPAVSHYLGTPPARFLMDWYFMRLVITVTPRRILWWERGGTNARPHELEVLCRRHF